MQILPPGNLIARAVSFKPLPFTAFLMQPATGILMHNSFRKTLVGLLLLLHLHKNCPQSCLPSDSLIYHLSCILHGSSTASSTIWQPCLPSILHPTMVVYTSTTISCIFFKNCTHFHRIFPSISQEGSHLYPECFLMSISASLAFFFTAPNCLYFTRWVVVHILI
jgi:hypothetical protein